MAGRGARGRSAARVRLLIDMNLSPRWVETLAEQGIEAVHWSSVGDARAPDGEILSYAKEHGDVLLTHDLDFGAILASIGLKSPSVIQLRFGTQEIASAREAVLSALDQFANELQAGALLTVDSRAARVSVLPLRR